MAWGAAGDVGIGRVLVRAFLGTELERLAAVESYEQATAQDMEEAHRLFMQAAQATAVVMYRYVESVRRKSWNFLVDYDFSPQRQVGRLFVGERRNYIGFAPPPMVFRSLKMGEDLELAEGGVSTIAASITAGAEKSIAWSVLGWARRAFDVKDDTRQATLEAAIAVEVGSTQGLLRSAPPSELLQLVVAKAELSELRMTIANVVLG